jgi:hypothetical protein
MKSLRLWQSGKTRRVGFWDVGWLVVAVAYAIPIAWSAYDKVIETNYQARARLIEQHRLWELQPDYRGRPEMWTRIASHLLTDRQLMMRVAARYGPLSQEIELDYRRDLTIARAEIVLTAVALWTVPLGALYALAWLVRRRPARPPAKVQPPSISDPRYKPPESSE